MLDYIVKWSIAQRWLIVIASILISVWGFLVLTQMPLDVFPNFAPPQVEIMTEAPGLAAEEVESLLAVVVLGGLFTSTALTLLVLPASYMQFRRFLVPRKAEPIIQPEIGRETRA